MGALRDMRSEELEVHRSAGANSGSPEGGRGEIRELKNFEESWKSGPWKSEAAIVTIKDITETAESFRAPRAPDKSGIQSNCSKPQDSFSERTSVSQILKTRTLLRGGNA